MKKKFKAILKILLVILVISIIRNSNIIEKCTHKTKYVKNPDDIGVLINRYNHLSQEYKPDDLTVPNIKFVFKEDLPKNKMRKEAAEAIEKMFSDAKSKGIVLYGVSGYRSYETQDALYKERVKSVGKKEAEKYVARPGESEHQSGLAMDVGTKNYLHNENIGNTKEGKWLKDNAYKYGFIIRYPKEKEYITGVNYEPWHIRYVGCDMAKAIESKGITLEEYYGKTSVGRIIKK